MGFAFQLNKDAEATIGITLCTYRVTFNILSGKRRVQRESRIRKSALNEGYHNLVNMNKEIQLIKSHYELDKYGHDLRINRIDSGFL